MRRAGRPGRCHRYACDRGGLTKAFYFDLVLGLLGLVESRSRWYSWLVGAVFVAGIIAVSVKLSHTIR
jgi:hypothetical protein